jgi:hypothetical protein
LIDGGGLSVVAVSPTRMLRPEAGMTATTPPRALPPASAAEVARLLHRANGDTLNQQLFGAAVPGWQRSWALPASAGLAAAPLAGLAAAALTGSLGIGLLCALLVAGITATGAWLLAYSAPSDEPEPHALALDWTQAKIFDDLYDS